MKDKVPQSIDKRGWRPSTLFGQIVLVTTLNEDGASNVAPKSWISMMGFEPSMLAVGCNLGHWTAKNVLARHQFVVNVPGAELIETVWSSHALPHPRPVESLGLTPRAAQRVAPPLIEECKAHLECEYLQHLEFGAEVVIFGRIVAAAMDRAALEAEDPYAYLSAIAFLEPGRYGVIERGRPLQERGA